MAKKEEEIEVFIQPNENSFIKNLEQKFKSVWWISLLTCICFIALGIVILFYPEATITLISYVLAGVMITIGVLNFITYFKNKETVKFMSMSLVFGIISALLGILLIFKPFTLAVMVQYILGIWIIISSAIKVQYAFNLKNYDEEDWLPALIIGIVMLLLGLILILNPFSSAVALTQVIGVLIIIYSIMDLIETFLLRSKIKKAIKAMK